MKTKTTLKTFIRFTRCMKVKDNIRNLIRVINGQPFLKRAEICLPDITYILDNPNDITKEHYYEYVDIKCSDNKKQYIERVRVFQALCERDCRNN